MDEHFEPSPPGAPSPTFGYDLSNWIAWLMDSAGRGQVRGEDQLFSYKGVVEGRFDDSYTSTGWKQLNGAVVPAGEIWVIESALCYYEGGGVNMMLLGKVSGPTFIYTRTVGAVLQYESCNQQTRMILEAGDVPVALVDVTAQPLDFHLMYNGHSMTLEV